MFVMRHIPVNLPGKEGSQARAWGPPTVGILKAILMADYRGIPSAHVQNYPGEFCYIRIRRYHGFGFV
jgi:hypothetical protein